MIANGAMIAVNSPDNTIAKLLNAPSVSPISMALVVPATCAAFPMANPRAIGLCNFNFLHMISLTDAPKIPVITTADTVKATIPPNFSVISMAMAVVTDFHRAFPKIVGILN